VPRHVVGLKPEQPAAVEGNGEDLKMIPTA
jgi:hypothetical protein